jgi:DNA-binding NarL/FixJ family response regulator
MITDALDEIGMTVLVAIEGEQALSMIDRITPDVVLMDAVMPGLDGFETCRMLKQTKSVAHVPVIFMTGLSETEHIVKGFDAGGVDYLTKPISPDELIARIRVHLANARLAQSAQAALDASGRHLLAANQAGRILWCTPQAAKLLRATFSEFDSDRFILPADLQRWLQVRGSDAAALSGDLIPLHQDAAERKLRLSYVGRIGADEILLRLTDEETTREEIVLKQKLSLTLREAEVLTWIARGKSNRDIAEILGLSPRTVNKHLEQVYTKLGVENRTAAATLAMRTLGTG